MEMGIADNERLACDLEYPRAERFALERIEDVSICREDRDIDLMWNVMERSL